MLTIIRYPRVSRNDREFSKLPSRTTETGLQLSSPHPDSTLLCL